MHAFFIFESGYGMGSLLALLPLNRHLHSSIKMRGGNPSSLFSFVFLNYLSGRCQLGTPSFLSKFAELYFLPGAMQFYVVVR